MEPTPKKRRRWLIVAFVLAVVSLCSWWYWPRGDARFVGTWAVFSEGEFDAPIAEFIFHRNGSGQMCDANDPSIKMFFTWRFAEPELQIGPPTSSTFDPVALPLTKWMLALTGRAILLHSQAYQATVYPDETGVGIHLQDQSVAAPTLHLRRVPE